MLAFSLVAITMTAQAAKWGPSADSLVRGPTTQQAGVNCAFGYLPTGEQLPDISVLRLHRPHYAWGTQTLVDTIIEASLELAYVLPDAGPLTVGDLSKSRGGHLPGHRSHKDGRDADLGLYFQTADGLRNNLVNPGSAFDVEANWMMIEALLDTGNVERIFLDRRWIGRLQRYLRTHDLMDEDAISELFPASGGWDRSGVIAHVPGHANHLHVRVRCE